MLLLLLRGLTYNLSIRERGTRAVGGLKIYYEITHIYEYYYWGEDNPLQQARILNLNGSLEATCLLKAAAEAGLLYVR